MEILFASERYFIQFDFHASHGQLLLRSQGINGNNNIDIIFFDTKYIQLHTSLYGLSIRSIDKTEYEGYKSVGKYLSYDLKCLFEITSKEEKFLIAASFFHVYENNIQESTVGRTQIGREKLLFASRI